MNFRIWHKLAILLLLSTSLTIIIGIGLSQQNFKRGFQDYLQNQEQRRLRVLSANLIQAYEENNSWAFLRNNNRRWFAILGSSGEYLPPGRNRGRPEHSPRRHFPPSERTLHNGFRPIRSAGRPKLALLNTDKQLIVGTHKLTQSSLLHPLKSGGKLIAYIVREKRVKVIDRLDKLFAAQQDQAFMTNTLVSLVVSLIVALLASMYFRKRINTLTHIAQKLTSGHYEQRVHMSQKDELGQLAHTFNTLAATLQQNQQSQQQWIADISHELRTPVAILKGELEALEDGIRPLDKEAIYSLQQEIERLNKLIEDLYQLSVADMGALKYEKSEFDFNDLLQEIYDHFKLRFDQHHLTLHYFNNNTDVVNYYGDRQRLYQLLSNLLENSLRYTDAGGEVWLKCLNNETNLTLIVEDSAPGIKEDKLTHIFDRLFRLEGSRNRSKGGAGLGLAIVKQIIMAHEGEILAFGSDLGGVKILCRLKK